MVLVFSAHRRLCVVYYIHVYVKVIVYECMCKGDTKGIRRANAVLKQYNENSFCVLCIV